jgi:2'-5' RNA ligase
METFPWSAWRALKHAERVALTLHGAQAVLQSLLENMSLYLTRLSFHPHPTIAKLQFRQERASVMTIP